jgi:nitrate reductase molybdenum cofactor assembly chaperone
MISAPSHTQSPPTIETALSLLSRLLTYPSGDFDDVLVQALETMDSLPLIAFRSAMDDLTRDQHEELYTATFDVTPRCVPYTSIHLFGEENFKRGEYMAALHSQYEQVGFDPVGELPDHIAVLLRYAATLVEPARRELVAFCILGPLAKITNALPEDHPYRFVLDAVDETLRSAYPGIEVPPSPAEQMRQHGTCPTVADGCGCGLVASPIIDGPTDDDSSAEASAPFSTPTL